MKRPLLLVAAVAGIMALIVSACGGSEATATPAPTATKPPAPTATAVSPAATNAPPTATRPPAPTTAPGVTPAPAPTTAPAPTATPAPQATKRGGVLEARSFREWTNIDAYHVAGGYSNNVMAQMLNNLIRNKRNNFEIEGDLAQTWQVSGDGKTITFNLRKDVKWHDGVPFNSQDILFNFKKAGDPKFQFSAQKVAPIATMETPDDSTFRVTLKQPSNSFVPGIATAFFLIQPAHIPDSEAFQKAPTGTGAFKMSDFRSGVGWKFVKNDNYYGKDPAGRPLPYLDGINFTIIVDPQLSLAAFRAGRLHCGCTYDQDFIDPAVDVIRRDVVGVKLSTALGPRIDLQLNMKKAPFSGKAVRQAIGIGLDKEQVAAVTLQGRSFRPAPPLIPAELSGQWALPKAELTKIPGYNPDHAADVKIARQKLQEAGIDVKSLNIELLMSGVFYGAVGEAIASSLSSDLGVKTTIFTAGTTVESTQRQRDGNYMMNLLTYPMTIDDPSDNYSNLIATGGGLNYSGFSNARLDQLLATQDSELDATKRRAALWEVQKIQLDEWPLIPILWNVATLGTRPEVEGFVLGPTTVHAHLRLEMLWLIK